MAVIKKIIVKVYILALIGFVLWYANLVTHLIFDTGSEGGDEVVRVENPVEKDVEVEEEVLKELIQEQKQTAVTDLGYKVIKEQYIKGHFHHTGFSVEPDTHNICIRCHGDVPHDRAKAIRAFLNMHAFYLACQTCHIRPKDGKTAWKFRWYDKKTGDPIGNPPELLSVDIDKYGNYGAKIAPGIIEKGVFRFLLNDEKERKIVEEYIKNKEILTPTQQSKMKKIIHRAVSDQPMLCDGCHTTKKPYLPFDKLGYPPHRINDLTSTEVVGLVKKYKEFYVPKMLLPTPAGE